MESLSPRHEIDWKRSGGRCSSLNRVLSEKIERASQPARAAEDRLPGVDRVRGNPATSVVALKKFLGKRWSQPAMRAGIISKL